MTLAAIAAWNLVPAVSMTGVDFLGIDGLILAATVAVAVATYAGRRRAIALQPAAAESVSAEGGTPAAAPGRRWGASLVAPLVASRHAAALTLCAGLLLVLAGQQSFADGESSAFALLFWLLGLGLIVGLERAADPLAGVADAPPLPRGRERSRWRGAAQTVFVVAAGAGAVIVWTAQRARAPDDAHGDIVLVWILTMVAALLAVWRPPIHDLRARGRAWIAANRTDLLLAGGLTILGAIPLLYRLDSYPWPFNGDEGVFTLSALGVLDGQIRNPFGTGVQSHPSLFFYLEAGTMWLVGETVTGARLIAALMGILSLPAMYALTIRYFDRTTAIVATTLLLSFHAHIFWAREAQNNVSSTLFAPLVLFLLDRALRNGDRLSFFLTGMALGWSQYFYVGNRVLPLVALGCVLFVALSAAWRRVPKDEIVRKLGPGALLLIAGFAVVVAPLFAHYSQYSHEYTGRINIVSIFASGWLDRETAATGRSSIAIIWDLLVQAAMVPFRTELPTGQYRGEPPFIGWLYAIPAAIGLAVATARAFQRRYLAIVATYWVVVVGMALTTPPPETNRFAVATPLLCLFAAVGIAAVARIAIRLLRFPRAVAAALTIALVAITAAWSLHYYFHDPNQIALYSDPNTQVAEHLGRDIVRIDPAATVYFAGPPRMWYDGFANLIFRTPDATGISLEEPLDPRDAPPELTGTTIYAFLPERRAELAVVQGWFPGGELIERADDDLGPLYTAYVISPDAPTPTPSATPSPAITPTPAPSPTPTPTPMPPTATAAAGSAPPPATPAGAPSPTALPPAFPASGS